MEISKTSGIFRNQTSVAFTQDSKMKSAATITLIFAEVAAFNPSLPTLFGGRGVTTAATSTITSRAVPLSAFVKQQTRHAIIHSRRSFPALFMAETPEGEDEEGNDADKEGALLAAQFFQTMKDRNVS